MGEERERERLEMQNLKLLRKQKTKDRQLEKKLERLEQLNRKEEEYELQNALKRPNSTECKMRNINFPKIILINPLF